MRWRPDDPWPSRHPEFARYPELARGPEPSRHPEPRVIPSKQRTGVLCRCARIKKGEGSAFLPDYTRGRSPMNAEDGVR
jgi:hypothetical protein